jgi:hypothetical protein
MSRDYQKQIANKLKHINERYVNYEDKKELVGGNFNELLDVKEGMGLKGKGMASTSLPAGVGLTACGMSGAGGMKKYKKVQDVSVCEMCGSAVGAGMSGGAILGYEGKGMSGGKKTKKGKGMSGGEVIDFEQLEGGCYGVCDGEGMTAVEKKGIKKKVATHFDGGALNPSGTRNGNQAIMGSGGVKLNKPKKKMMEGKGVLDVLGKVAKYALETSLGEGMSGGVKKKMKGKGIMDAFSSRVKSDMKNIRKNLKPRSVESVEPAEPVVSGAGMGKRPTTQNMPSSSFSGGAKKPNKRAEIVKKIMKEKGMKMIEASKYVKEHKLY